MRNKKLIAQLNELCQKSNELRAEYMKLDDELYAKLDKIVKGIKCPVCGSSGLSGLYSYDCHGGSFGVGCYNCGMSTPHTIKLDVVLDFLEALESGFTANVGDLRTRDGDPITKRKGKKNA